MIITIRLAALRLACAELRKFVTTRAQPAGLSHGGIFSRGRPVSAGLVSAFVQLTG